MTRLPGPDAHSRFTVGDSESGRGPSPQMSPGRVARLLAPLRATRTGRLGVRIGIGVLGLIVVLGGLVLVPLPGPGWLIVFAGLAIWSLEFHWAARLQAWGRRQFSRWTSWVMRHGWPVRIAVGVATAVFVAAVVVLSLWLSFGPGIFDRVRGLF